jgi:hypothetical protein
MSCSTVEQRLADRHLADQLHEARVSLWLMPAVGSSSRITRRRRRS